MKRIVVVGLLTLAAATPHANAGSWLKQEKPCGTKCVMAAPARPQDPFAHQNLGDPNRGNLVYQSQSRSVFQSSYGTSVINGTLRIYR
jgi:hypothetical protein